jgi:hypothetical protein
MIQIYLINGLKPIPIQKNELPTFNKWAEAHFYSKKMNCQHLINGLKPISFQKK